MSTSTEKIYILIPVETDLLILAGKGITEVVINVLPLTTTVAAVVIFLGLYFGSSVTFKRFPIKLHVPFMVVTSGLSGEEKVITNV